MWPEMKRLQTIVLLLCAAWLLLVACTDVSRSQTDREATVEALGRAVVLTATADVDDEISPQRLLATAEAAATEAVATIAAAGTEAASLALTATAVADLQPGIEPAPEATPAPPAPAGFPAEAIEAELLLYRVDPAAGAPAWFAEEVVVSGEGLQQTSPDDPAFALPLQDFVLAADVLLENGSQDAACGFSLRGGGDEPFDSYYLLLLGYPEAGSISFEGWQDGALAPDEARGAAVFDAAALDPAFNLEAGAANRLAVVAQGDTFFLYSNGAPSGTVRPLLLLREGAVGFTAVRSGDETAVCRFENAWLWLPER
jgi:predicted pyridoxine 5'-phosphate oxidase superfamily flavin-nucleotide-binding protein